MHIRITNWTGTNSDGIVLSVRGLVLRVAIPGCDDSVEYYYRGNQWFAENHEPVQIEFFSTRICDPDCVPASLDRSETSWAQACARVH